jgi:hypothetical protein
MARTLALVGVLCAALVPIPAAGEEPGIDLSGVYACKGQNPDGTPYAAVVEIVKRQDTYVVRWTMPEDVQVTGVGIQRGSVLAVSYVGGGPAIVVYSVGGDGRLDGTWTLAGAQGAVFSETLTRVGDVLVRPAAPRQTPRPAPERRRRPAPGTSL